MTLDEKQRFSIRKFSVGAASVLIGLSFSLYSGQQVSADTVDNSDKSVVANAQDKDTIDNTQNNKEEKENTTQAQNTVTANLDHATVVASYEANTTIPSEKASVSVESKEADKAAAADENTNVENNASTKQVELEDKVNNVTSEKSTASAQADTAADKKTTVDVKATSTNSNVDTKKIDVESVKTNDEKVTNAVSDNSSDLKNTVTDEKSEITTNTLNVNEAIKNASFLSAKAATESKAVTLAAEAEDSNAITVSTAQDFINAIQKGTATTINVTENLNLGEIRNTSNVTQTISNKRDIVIQSANGEKKTIDLNGYSFNMNSNNSVTFKDLTMYGRNWFGAVENAGSYTFDNVDYTGSELVYTNRSATVTFKNTVTAHAVDKYTSPLNGTEYNTQTGQQVLQFTTGTNQIIFDEGSNVTLTTDNGNVIQNQGNATITVKNGATVTLNPHASTRSFENAGTVGQVARGIYSAGGAINVEQGGNLVINLSQNSGDPYLPGALYLSNGATINDNGTIKINVNGQPSTGNSMPVYLDGASTINVGNNATFEIDANNLESYASSLFKITGTGTVNLEPHSTFKISGDGTGALTAIELGKGSTFTSDQPKEFTIDLSANTNSTKTLIKNGTINFTRVKNTNVASQYQVALGKVDVTYSSAGALSNSVINSLNKDVPTTIYDYIKNNPSALSFVAAGEDVTLSNLHLNKNNQLTGIATSTGDSNTPIYITVLLNNSATGIPEVGMYRVYTDTD